MKQTNNAYKHQKGFTLLEVLVAITLTALVLGNLFAMQSQSKKLAYKSTQALLQTINQRAILNALWINNKDENKYLSVFDSTGYKVAMATSLKVPENQYKPLKYSLESIEITDINNNIILNTVRIKESAVKKLNAL